MSLRTDFVHLFSQRPDVKLNKKVFVFILCLVISSFSWIQINLSKQQLENIPVRVDFVNLPKARFGATAFTDTLLIEVEADGYAFLKYEMKAVQIDFRKLKRDPGTGTFYFLPNNYIKTISKQLDDNMKIVRAVTDTVVLNPRDL